MTEHPDQRAEASLISSCYCFAARQAARRLTSIYDNALATVHLTSSQFALLAFLKNNPCVSLQELAAALCADRTTVTRAVALLEKAGFVAALPRVFSKEKLQLHLTESGSDRLEAARPYWLSAQHHIEEVSAPGMAAHLRTELLDLVSRLA